MLTCKHTDINTHTCKHTITHTCKHTHTHTCKHTNTHAHAQAHEDTQIHTRARTQRHTSTIMSDPLLASGACNTHAAASPPIQPHIHTEAAHMLQHICSSIPTEQTRLRARACSSCACAFVKTRQSASNHSTPLAYHAVLAHKLTYLQQRLRFARSKAGHKGQQVLSPAHIGRQVDVCAHLRHGRAHIKACVVRLCVHARAVSFIVEQMHAC